MKPIILRQDSSTQWTVKWGDSYKQTGRAKAVNIAMREAKWDDAVCVEDKSGRRIMKWHP